MYPLVSSGRGRLYIKDACGSGVSENKMYSAVGLDGVCE